MSDDTDRRHAEKMAKRKQVQDAEVASKTITSKGLLMLNTGPGKGKSTAAFGLVLRALGHGWPVGVVQFVKGAWDTGEKHALERFSARDGTERRHVAREARRARRDDRAARAARCGDAHASACAAAARTIEAITDRGRRVAIIPRGPR